MVSLGIGALVAFSKSKKHYVGIVWDSGDGKKGGIALQVDKDEFRGLIAALEGITGKKAIDTEALTEAAAKTGLSQPVASPAAPTNTGSTRPAQSEPPSVTPAIKAPVASAQAEPVRATPPVSARAEPIQAPPPTPVATVQARSEPVRVIPTSKPVAIAPVKPLPTVQITFASNPPGAVVTCNGTRFGQTPFVIPMLPGTYPVKFTLAGYPDWDAEINVEEAKPSTLVAQLNSTTGVWLK